MAPEPTTVNIGTRKSPLALKQVELVVAELQAAHPHVNFVVHGVSTMGDRDKTTPLPALGKGLWTTELETKLLSGEVDLVVHCLKDMPTHLPAGCALGCVPAREDPRDVVVFPAAASSSSSRMASRPSLAQLAPGSVVGTSSVRRTAQLRRRYPGLAFKDIRGNIDTRLAKLDAEDGPYDCIILAAAGLLRMGLGKRIAQFLDSSTDGGGMLHAVGQGALAMEVREGDARVVDILRTIEDVPTQLACFSERSVMRTLEGGCSVPIGVETSWVGEGEAKRLRLRATVVSLDGAEGIDAEHSGTVTSVEEAEAFGQKVAQDLVSKGAQRILDVINETRPPTTAVPEQAVAS